MKSCNWQSRAQSNRGSSVSLFFATDWLSGSDFEVGAGTGLSRSSLNSSSSAENNLFIFGNFEVFFWLPKVSKFPATLFAPVS